MNEEQDLGLTGAGIEGADRGAGIDRNEHISSLAVRVGPWLPMLVGLVVAAVGVGSIAGLGVHADTSGSSASRCHGASVWAR